MELTEEQRLSIIKYAVHTSKQVAPTKPINDFIEEIKSQELIGEHGLLKVQITDIEDEMSLIHNDPCAESLDEEDGDIGVSTEMRGAFDE